MGPANVESFYESLQFEWITIDDQDVLFYELLDDGTYLIVTDDDGHTPTTVKEPIVISIYDSNDSFLWSVTLDNSTHLKELLEKADSMEEFMTVLSHIRQENILLYDKQQ